MKKKSSLASIIYYWPNIVLRKFYNKIMRNSSVSTGYVELKGQARFDEALRLRGSWKSNELPDRQRDLVDSQLKDYRYGFPVLLFDVLISSLNGLPELKPEMCILEIGCSSGYYSEVLNIAGIGLKYSGCDYSTHFIDMARQRYPECNFSVEDATCLGYADQSFDIVVSGCCILHIPEYQKAVCETVRVARQYVIFHRTPVVWGKDDVWYRKHAYGVETIEIHFNESKFLDLLKESGLEITSIFTLSEEVAASHGHAVRTYVCRKLS